jgi:HEAT repeat protein
VSTIHQPDEEDRPGDLELIAALVTGLGHERWIVRESSEVALAQVVPALEVRALLADQLAQEPERTAGSIIRVLSNYRSGEAVEAFRRLLQDPNPVVANAARKMPWRGWDQEPIGEVVLREVLNDPDPRVRLLAGSRLGHSLDPYLDGDDDELRRLAALQVDRGPIGQSNPILWKMRWARSADAAERDTAFVADANPSLRAIGAMALGATGKAEHLPLLRRLLDDPDAEVRDGALRGLAMLGQPEGLADLLSTVLNPATPHLLQAELAEELGRMGKPALATLIDMALTADGAARHLAIIQLRRFPDDPGAIDVLRRLATDAEIDRDVRGTAFWTLSQMGATGVTALLDLLPSLDGEALRDAVARLYFLDDPRIGASLRSFLAPPHPDWQIRRDAIHGIAGTSNFAVPFRSPFESEAQFQERMRRDEWGRQQARSNVPLISRFLTDPSPEVRAAAAYDLSIVDRAYAARLNAALVDDDASAEERRLGAFFVAAQIDPNPAVQEHLPKLLNDPGLPEDARAALAAMPIPEEPALAKRRSVRRRERARRLAARTGLPVASGGTQGWDEGLRRHLRSVLLDTAQASDDRREAAALLGAVRDRGALPALVAASEDADPAVRLAVARALAGLKDVRAVSILLSFDGDGSGALAETTHVVLQRLGSRMPAAVAAWLTEDRTTLRVTEVRPRHVAPDYAALLAAPGAETRRIALRCLEYLGAARWADYIAELCADPVTGIAATAEHLLRRHAIAAAIPVLARLAEHPTGDIRRRALRVLASHPTPENAAYLRRALSDRDLIVRRIAVAGLARSADPGGLADLRWIAGDPAEPAELRALAARLLHRHAGRTEPSPAEAEVG